MTKIKVEHLTKIFGKRKKQALEMIQAKKSKSEILKETGASVGVYDVSFEVEEGEIFVIMGLSGSGKSTLIRLLNRLIFPTNGHVFIDNQDISSVSKKELLQIRRQKMSMVFQNFGLFPHRTILENTEFGLEARGIGKKERIEKARGALQNSGLLDYQNQYPNQLSGGMQQRVGLARAIANDPEILLMDEAFSALDPLIRREMQTELLNIQDQLKKTIIFITHDLNEALRIGDRIALMKDGEIVQIGTGEEILTNPANDYVESFIEDIDKSRILTAENIMIPAVTINIDVDGPRVALNRMRQEEISLLIATNASKQLVGYITAEDAYTANKEKKELREFLKQDIPTIEKDMKLHDIFNIIHQVSSPVIVLDGGKIAGVIVKGIVIEALATSENASDSEARKGVES